MRQPRLWFLSALIILGIGIGRNFLAFETEFARPLKERILEDPVGALFGTTPTANTTTTIAYAITVTNFQQPNRTTNETTTKLKSNLLDRAAVLHQSIKLAMSQTSKYDYHIHAFVHPEAIGVKPYLERLGYIVHIKDTPFDVNKIENEYLKEKQTNGCCGDKEYLKLYSYLLFDYPVVVHVDLDYLFLKPMEDLFDFMTDPYYDPNNFQNSTMWPSSMTNLTTIHNKNGSSIDFLYTRDYNMVKPGVRQPYQIGVQGGFLVLRPSQHDFDKFVSTILSGGGYVKGGWGNGLQFGGYYGSATIQGLASYYYGHLEPNRDIELNRCYYNTMVDNPYYTDPTTNITKCRTTQATCQDCREVPIQDIYSVHLTLCSKPEHCNLNPKNELCRQLMTKWHHVRTSLEDEWATWYNLTQNNVNVKTINNAKYEKSTPGNEHTNPYAMLRNYGGHCGSHHRRKKYIPMVFPPMDDDIKPWI